MTRSRKKSGAKQKRGFALVPVNPATALKEHKDGLAAAKKTRRKERQDKARVRFGGADALVPGAKRKALLLSERERKRVPVLRAAGLTQVETAAVLHCAPSTVSCVERGVSYGTGNAPGRPQLASVAREPESCVLLSSLN